MRPTQIGLDSPSEVTALIGVDWCGARGCLGRRGSSRRGLTPRRHRRAAWGRGEGAGGVRLRARGEPPAPKWGGAAGASVLTASPPVSSNPPPQCRRSSGCLWGSPGRLKGDHAFGQLALQRRLSAPEPQAAPSWLGFGLVRSANPPQRPHPCRHPGAGTQAAAWPCFALGAVAQADRRVHHRAQRLYLEDGAVRGFNLESHVEVAVVPTKCSVAW